MATAAIKEPSTWTAADLAKEFGPIAISRIRMLPLPGHATERDVVRIHRREKRLCELVDGVLVEKVMGFQKSALAGYLIGLLQAFLAKKRLGVVAGADGMMRMAPGRVRIPDISFVSWDKFPSRRVPPDPLPNLVPDLAVEVLSEGNTAKEMGRKLMDYFEVGVRIVWYIDPKNRTVEVFTAPNRLAILREGQALDGGEVLPGFSVKLRKLFAQMG